MSKIRNTVNVVVVNLVVGIRKEPTYNDKPAGAGNIKKGYFSYLIAKFLVSYLLSKIIELIQNI